MSDTASPDAEAQFCGHCGEPQTGGSHDACGVKLGLEPPRYCSTCRRRMMVQVTPSGWTSRCSEHGESGAQTWAAPDG